MGKVHGDIIAFPLVKSGNISRKLLTKIIKKKTKVLSGYNEAGSYGSDGCGSF